MKASRIRKRPVLALVIAGLSLLVAPWVPLLMVRFRSPQYPTESPTLSIYADRFAGDAHEFQVLSHYVGIHFPPSVPELESGILVWIISGLGAVALLSALLRRPVQRALAFLLLLAIFTLAGWGQFRFYQSGHDLDQEAPMRMVVKPFTPPLFGFVRIHNISIYHLPHVGSILILSSVLALALAARRRASELGAPGQATALECCAPRPNRSARP